MNRKVTTQPSLFETTPEPDTTDLDAAIQDITDAMDRWQVLLSVEDWATVRERVEIEFRLTSMVAEKPKPPRKKGSR